MYNLKNFTRKSNVSLLFAISQNQINDSFYTFFDFVLLLTKLDFDFEETTGTVRLLKNDSFDSFSEEEKKGMNWKRVFFYGINKQGLFSLRDVDVTEFM